MVELLSPRPMASWTCRAVVLGGESHFAPNLIWRSKRLSQSSISRTPSGKRLFNAVATAQNRQRDGRPMVRLISEVLRPVRFSSPAEFAERRRLLNERLLLCGFEVGEDGRIHRVRAADPLREAQRRTGDIRVERSRRDVHPMYSVPVARNSCSRTTSTPCWKLPGALPTSCMPSLARLATAIHWWTRSARWRPDRTWCSTAWPQVGAIRADGHRNLAEGPVQQVRRRLPASPGRGTSAESAGDLGEEPWRRDPPNAMVYGELAPGPARMGESRVEVGTCRSGWDGPGRGRDVGGWSSRGGLGGRRQAGRTSAGARAPAQSPGSGRDQAASCRGGTAEGARSRRLRGPEGGRQRRCRQACRTEIALGKRGAGSDTAAELGGTAG